jgi:hypothetical protein
MADRAYKISQEVPRRLDTPYVFANPNDNSPALGSSLAADAPPVRPRQFARTALSLLAVLAAMSAGLFAGAALYVSAVEHPARMSCGPELAVREFGPSYRRGTIMQASLALLGSTAGFFRFLGTKDPWVLAASVLLVSVVPFTLIVILPTNKRLLDPSLDSKSGRAVVLLERWGHLHAVRTTSSALAFMIFLWRLING